MTKWIDAHTHLDAEELFPQLPAVLSRAVEAGVSRMLLVNSEASEESIQRTRSIDGSSIGIQTFFAFGIHPHHASQYEESLEAILLRSLKHPRVIAFGEIGLDFYYNFSPVETQEKVLSRQLALAEECRLPLVIHCRDAYGRLSEVLRSRKTEWRGMIHCFTGTAEEAKVLLDLGFFISFSGILTFRSAETLRVAARYVPPDRLMIETDAPYLAPVPFRGKTNEPAYVVETGKALASLKEISLEKLQDQLERNFVSLFNTPAA